MSYENYVDRDRGKESTIVVAKKGARVELIFLKFLNCALFTQTSGGRPIPFLNCLCFLELSIATKLKVIELAF